MRDGYQSATTAEQFLISVINDEFAAAKRSSSLPQVFLHLFFTLLRWLLPRVLNINRPLKFIGRVCVTTGGERHAQQYTVPDQHHYTCWVFCSLLIPTPAAGWPIERFPVLDMHLMAAYVVAPRRAGEIPGGLTD